MHPLTSNSEAFLLAKLDGDNDWLILVSVLGNGEPNCDLLLISLPLVIGSGVIFITEIKSLLAHSCLMVAKLVVNKAAKQWTVCEREGISVLISELDFLF